MTCSDRWSQYDSYCYCCSLSQGRSFDRDHYNRARLTAARQDIQAFLADVPCPETLAGTRECRTDRKSCSHVALLLRMPLLRSSTLRQQPGPKRRDLSSDVQRAAAYLLKRFRFRRSCGEDGTIRSLREITADLQRCVDEEKASRSILLLA